MGTLSELSFRPVPTSRVHAPRAMPSSSLALHRIVPPCGGLSLGSCRTRRSWLTNITNTSARKRQKGVEMSRRQHGIIHASSFDTSNPQDEPSRPWPRPLPREVAKSRTARALEMRQRLAKARRGDVNTQQAVNDGTSASTAEPRQPNIFKVLWDRVIRPLSDFGFGRKSIWEGGVGLFLMGGFGTSPNSDSFHRHCPTRRNRAVVLRTRAVCSHPCSAF